MRTAVSALGAHVKVDHGALWVTGTSRPAAPASVIHCGGSALVFRTMLALASYSGAPTILSGDHTLRLRPMAPLFSSLGELGAVVEEISEAGCAPAVNWGRGLRGGHAYLPPDVSSQFLTALLFAAPLAERRLILSVGQPLRSRSYVDQTIVALARAGITVEVSSSNSIYCVEPGPYRPFEVGIGGDFTSASYLMLLASLFPGSSLTLRGLEEDSLQGERLMLDALEAVGAKVGFNRKDECQIEVSNELQGDLELDLSNGPNVFPTLAVLGAFIPGTTVLVGARLTNDHKCPRITAVAEELRRFGVKLSLIYDGNSLDGLRIQGRRDYKGDAILDSHGDHRLLMALAVACTRMSRATSVTGSTLVAQSYPNFYRHLTRLGVQLADEPLLTPPAS